MKKIAIYGAGSFGQEVVCLIKKINSKLFSPDVRWNVIGYYDDDKDLWGKQIPFGKVIGGINELNQIQETLAIAIGIANVSILKTLKSRINNPNIYFPCLIDPDTSFTDIDSLHLGQGNIIGEGCRIGPNVTIGDFNVIVNDSVIGHDVVIGNYNVLFPAVRLSGKVYVENNNTFGVGTVILPSIKILSDNKFAPGSYLLMNADNGFIYQGNPARKRMCNEIIK